MLVRPDLTGLANDEIDGFEHDMDAAWDEVRLIEPASFALALVAADRATVAHIAARCDPATPRRRLAGLEQASDEAEAVRVSAERVLMHQYSDHLLAVGDKKRKKLEQISRAIQKWLKEPDNVTDWARQARDRALKIRPNTSRDGAAAYLNELECARIGYALARYFDALADEAVDDLHLRARASATEPGMRTVERGSALGAIAERPDEDRVEEDEANRAERRRVEREARDRARAGRPATGRRRRAEAKNESCRVQ
ncbi:hypothetical protein JCM3775_007188 [Rhodotorula graminis]